MRITQGTFSFLPDLTDAQIEAQLRYALRKGWAVMVEHTDDPHPRNILWSMWDQPRFDLHEDEVQVAMDDIRSCREAHPDEYVKVVCYDRSLGRQATALSFIVQRPEHEPGFLLERTGGPNRQLRYTLHPYAADRPAGARYPAPDEGGRR
jgi:ribulose-bisphosphate carboxylase small chain